MEKADITFILSLWGATLSTITALLGLKKTRKELKGELSINYKFSPDASTLFISATNISFRPLTIVAYDLIYAMDVNYFQLVDTCALEPPVKLQESEMHKQSFTAAGIKKAASDNGVRQHYYQRLYIRIITTNAGIYHRLVDIPPLLSPDGTRIDHQYICTDLLLGFTKILPPTIHRRDISRK